VLFFFLSGSTQANSYNVSALLVMAFVFCSGFLQVDASYIVPTELKIMAVRL
jgi:hypothetical protein